MFDTLLIGGGVIGLSLAYELVQRGQRVCILDRSAVGRATSWAAAGIFPPASTTSTDPVERFCDFSNRLHEQWATQLRADTGIDTGYRQCGAVYVARNDALALELRASAAMARSRGIRFEELSDREVSNLEPALRTADLCAAFLAPDESQLRSPRHLKALEAACAKRGVQMITDAEVTDFVLDGGQIRGVRTLAGVFQAERYCLTSGAWTAALTSPLGLNLILKPIRGQIVLLKLPRPPLTRIINEGPCYLVPRDDGRVLVGSTMEDVGFDTNTTSAAIDELICFAKSLSPALSDAVVEARWAGLRPGSADGNPYLGQVPGLSNAFVAAGHMRGGLHLSTGTAVVMAALLCGERPELDLAPFRVDRGS